MPARDSQLSYQQSFDLTIEQLCIGCKCDQCIFFLAGYTPQSLYIGQQAEKLKGIVKCFKEKLTGLVVSFCREGFLIIAATDSQVCKDCRSREQKMENETFMQGCL